MIKKNILILEGGKNEEHEVSLNSSRNVQNILKKLKINYSTFLVNPDNFEKKIQKYKNYICFNALHGPFGEDGQIQKILKKNKIKFTHANIKSSQNCFDKIKTKKNLSKKGIQTPRYTILEKKDFNFNNLLDIKKNYKKFVIKPVNSGSSFGIKIIKNNLDLNDLKNKFENYKKEVSNNTLMIEEYISGKELTVSTIKFSKNIKGLAVTEIKSRNKFFDYQAKYKKGFAKHILPARINKKNYKKCLKLAEKCHRILKCNSIARSDFIYNTKKNKIYFLETNTQPGLTSVSLFPEQLNFKKILFEDVIISILKNTN